ncbi:unnamed protein product [Adineta steineri]|uniref:Eukaryotic translation initiation factor 3 30 kDa subunit n=1 Tax=Adineta steineri TaxID=433720 RepID=A0A813P7H2_9BILA|nr:unnamed protein product [Adineta steineri]CAF0823358.1 unnamed protein product [Adineta steineri]CAF0863901.1 unnamed protein product [Adineta steineri]
MADHWQDVNIPKPQIVDDDDAPDDWETALEEKAKISDVEEKPKAAKSTSSKKKVNAGDESQKIIKQPDGDYTPEELDQIRAKEEIKEEQEKLTEVEELVDENGKVRSLDDLDLIKKSEFLNYSLRLASRLEVVSNSEFYTDFIDNFLTGITNSMSVDGVKRLTTTLQTINIRKQGEERERKAKAKAKNKAKPQLKAIKQSDYKGFGADVGHDYDQDNDYDDEDFM